jgi:DNA-binding NarL/FixJ family response regulator
VTADRERPARILIVDDEPLNVDYLEQELEALGFVTESAADGVQALERVASTPPDLVLLDVMMPELDGIGVLRTLKADPDTRLIPVVLMTALNAVEDRVRGIEAGADDFLSKPVDERELFARIRTALSLKRAIDETVDELESTSAHLEQYGRHQRHATILVIAWRLADGDLPGQAAAFLGRRGRAIAEERIRERGGSVCETDGERLVAVFDDTEAAVEAGLAAADESGPTLVVGAGISSGSAKVGSTRVEGRWVYGVEGEPVERASELAAATGITVAAEVAAEVSDRFALAPGKGGVHRVLGRAEGPAATRRIKTILVTDIIDSTRVAERMGDRAWAALLATHDDAVRDELARAGGEEIDAAGDGFLALFDGPARAILCALAISERVGALGLSIRTGVHTGEVEQVAGRARGIAIHIAARIAERAAAGEVLVGATTRELAAGSGLVFVDRGEHVMKGVSEPRRLYAARIDPVGHDSPAVPAGADEYPGGLTAREVDVLRLVAVGLSDAEVAERLSLSVRTVNAHLRSVYRKLGVSSRAAASEFAQQSGLV